MNTRQTSVDWTGPARQCCPDCSRRDNDKTLGVTVDEPGRGVAHCFRCGYVETLREDADSWRRRPQAVASPPRVERRPVLSDYGLELWGACRPISGPALAYLEARGCVIPPSDGHLRWHPELRHPPTGYIGPALVALLTDATDGRIARTLHRAWIRPDGTKAPEADPPRMHLGGHRKAGAVCRLWPDEAVTQGLGIAEGIETALSLAHGMTPVWAAVDAGNLAAFPVLPGIECLTIGVDHDPAGMDAARTCSERWRAADKGVRLVLPDAAGADLNDEVQHERAA